VSESTTPAGWCGELGQTQPATYEEILMTDDRAAFTAGLRQFADFLDANEQYPVPGDPRLLLCLLTNPAVEEFATRHGLVIAADEEGNLSADMAFGSISYHAYGYVDFEVHQAATAERNARDWASKQGLELVARGDQ
jgi:hypothetical protein